MQTIYTDISVHMTTLCFTLCRALSTVHSLIIDDLGMSVFLATD